MTRCQASHPGQDEHDQLVRASRLYYELGETQHAIAARLGVTRPHVSRLLKRARAEGIVEIRIVDTTVAESPAAAQLTERFGLDAVHLAPTLVGPEDLTRRMVGRLGAQVLRASARDGEIIGIGDGATVTAVAEALEDAATPVAATIVPLAGGYWSGGPEREPFRRIADAFGAQTFGLMAPGLLDDAATKLALEAHAGVRAILDLWDRLDLVLVGIGGRSWGAASVGERLARRLDERGAIGEVLIAPYALDGTFVGQELRERVLAFDARRLASVPTAIAVGAGESKVQPVLGALRAGIVRTLVTDVATAEAVVALDATR
ncbi:MAG TPA: sugar-binding domain-containing protein [Candidatus Limnocylindrales bacterium]|nr:sugar-binding domain-containing protein [Candidatus Limnocylindrales bacterium]